ncbi:MAG: YegS/Rv2252/BmrU family lipid kinase [Cyanobacteria bacterium J06581_3]
MFKNVYLIFNPVSGQGNSEEELAVIQQEIGAHTGLTVLKTTPEKPARALAKEVIAAGADCVVASGGDGTVSTVAGALVNTQATLGIVPRGTANAIAAAFGISDNISLACQTIMEGIPHQVDIAACNGKPLMLLAGIGLEADVISNANRQLKNKLGTAAYILSAFQQVQELEVFTAQLETKDKIITVEASGLTVANVAPATSVLAQGPSDVLPYDGLLDVTIFAPEGTGKAIAASYSLFQSALNKRSTKREDVGYFRCSAVKIITDPVQKVVVDGEIVGETPIEVICIPNGLTLMTPQAGEFNPLEKLQGLPGLKVELKS